MDSFTGLLAFFCGNGKSKKFKTFLESLREDKINRLKIHQSSELDSNVIRKHESI